MNAVATKPSAGTTRLRLAVRGAVQGVGFRPFVHRLANELGLRGWVNNDPQGVFIEVEGERVGLEDFRTRLAAEPPPHSLIQGCEASWLDPVGFDGFVIRASADSGPKTAMVLPDIATCPECLRELFDPANRRYRHPFINCTHCGPRFTLLEALPYDRSNTSMRKFRMCPECQSEYDNPQDRRFHAQPNACPVCGPQVELWPPVAPSPFGTAPCPGSPPRPLAHGHDAVLAAAHVIRCGQIVALKGIGGFHLFVDARNDEAIRRLRERKQREQKPFALMFPTLAQVREVCEVPPLAERLLASPAAPIVLLRRGVQRGVRISPVTAPDNPNLGVMLPSNPLHHLLLAELGFPVIATSANLSDEPICTDEFEALERLAGIADVFLVHDRPIVRPLDDSIVRVILDREMVLRCARGYAPLPVAGAGGRMPPAAADRRPAATILAVGAHLKSSVALAVDNQVFLSQHIGDLETEPARQAFQRVVSDLPRLYDAPPEVIAADLHPDYLSTRFALECRTPTRSEIAYAQPAGAGTGAPGIIRVQHHVAHVLACLREHDVELPVLGVAWDGTGLGWDGTIWGGEFFQVTRTSLERIAHWRPFRLPGGDTAVQEPRRAALGILHELYGPPAFARDDLAPVAAFAPRDRTNLQRLLAHAVNAPWCGSIGRLFDAVASLTGLRQVMQFEGQAAMELEFAAEAGRTDAAYEMPIAAGPAPIQLDWAPMIEGILADQARGVPLGEISARFHNTLVETLVRVAVQIGCPRVVLSGGCFQNRYLIERTVTRLRDEGFQPFWHHRVPPNDGGIALGQIVAAQRELRSRASPALQ